MTHDELRMGEGLRQSRHLSMAGVLQYPRAPRLDLPQGLFWSDVDLADVSFYQGKIDFAKMKASGINSWFHLAYLCRVCSDFDHLSLHRLTEHEDLICQRKGTLLHPVVKTL